MFGTSLSSCFHWSEMSGTVAQQWSPPIAWDFPNISTTGLSSNTLLQKLYLIPTLTICVCCLSTARCRGVCKFVFCTSLLAFAWKYKGSMRRSRNAITLLYLSCRLRRILNIWKSAFSRDKFPVQVQKTSCKSFPNRMPNIYQLWYIKSLISSSKTPSRWSQTRLHYALSTTLHSKN